MFPRALETDMAVGVSFMCASRPARFQEAYDYYSQAQFGVRRQGSGVGWKPIRTIRRHTNLIDKTKVPSFRF